MFLKLGFDLSNIEGHSHDLGYQETEITLQILDQQNFYQQIAKMQTLIKKITDFSKRLHFENYTFWDYNHWYQF